MRKILYAPCKSVSWFSTNKHNYICCGICTRPTQFKQDTVWLCMKGKVAERRIEMTPQEAKRIIKALKMAVNKYEI